MANINISFDNKNYNIDEASLSSASAKLKSHLLNVMNGTGSTIDFGGITYNIDSAKLLSATNTFISHLGTISGSGYNVILNGVNYSVDPNKLSGAITELHEVLGGLNSGGGSSSDRELIIEIQNKEFIFNPGTASYVTANSDWFPLEENTEYVVVWDGVEYPVISYRCVYNGTDAIILGNEQFVKNGVLEFTEPFVIGRGVSNNMCSIQTQDNSTTIHSVTIYKILGGLNSDDDNGGSGDDSAQASEYGYVTKISIGSNVQDIAINKDGTHVAVGLTSSVSAPLVYDISGGEPTIIAHGNSSGTMRKYDYNYNESYLYGFNFTGSSTSKKTYTYKFAVKGGTYGAAETVKTTGSEIDYGSFIRCSPVADIIAYGTPNKNNSAMNLNGVDVVLGGANASVAEFSPDGRYFAVSSRTRTVAQEGGENYCVEIYNVSDASLYRTINFGAGYARNVSFNKDSSLIAVCAGSAPYFRVYSVFTGEMVYSFDPSEFATIGACYFLFGTNELFVATGSTVRAFNFSEPSNPQEIENIPKYQGGNVFNIRSNKSGTRIAIYENTSHTIEIWERL